MKTDEHRQKCFEELNFDRELNAIGNRMANNILDVNKSWTEIETVIVEVKFGADN